VVKDISTFESEWWAWWIALQLSWRPTERPLPTETYGNDWTTLIAPGANGMLGVIASLYWWGKAVQGFEADVVVPNNCDGGWKEAVNDVILGFRTGNPLSYCESVSQ
jgi:hypothetical protein